MDKEKVKQIVLDIIAEIAPDEDLNDVKSDIRLRDQLDLDSMDFLDIVMELRKQHGIDVPEAEYRQLESLDSCANYLLPKFEAGATVTKRGYFTPLPIIVGFKQKIFFPILN